MAKLGQFNPAEMTAQEVINEAAKHLIEQGRPSIADNGESCLYNGDGVCCGAAPFLVDYDPCMEKKSYQMLVNNHRSQPKVHVKLIQGIQDCHDNAAVESKLDGVEFLPLVYNYLSCLCVRYNLEIPEIVTQILEGGEDE